MTMQEQIFKAFHYFSNFDLGVFLIKTHPKSAVNVHLGQGSEINKNTFLTVLIKIPFDRDTTYFDQIINHQRKQRSFRNSFIY